MEAIDAVTLLIHQQMMCAFVQGDAAGLAIFYSESSQIMPAYSAEIAGRAAIQAFWQGCIDTGIGTMQRTPVAVDDLGDTLNERGEYRFLDRHGQVIDIGKYVIIWKERQGQWQIQCDIWTSNLPPHPTVR